MALKPLTENPKLQRDEKAGKKIQLHTLTEL